jgi:hypothetical protein
MAGAYQIIHSWTLRTRIALVAMRRRYRSHSGLATAGLLGREVPLEPDAVGCGPPVRGTTAAQPVTKSMP